MSTRFFTNDNSNTLLKKFEGIFENNPELARFDALVGYLRASGIGLFRHPPETRQCPGGPHSGWYQRRYLRAFSDYIQQIPIPPSTAEEKSRLATLAEQCAAATAAGDKETLAAREHQINQLVYRLFHLTLAEIAMIEAATDASPA